MNYFSRTRLMLVGVALLPLANPAAALDGNDMVAKLNKALTLQGGGLAADAISVSGSDVTLTKARFAAPDGKQTVPLGNIKFEGVEESRGGYTVDSVTFDDVNVTEEKTTITASDISISGLVIPADPNGNSMDAVLIYDEAYIGKIGVVVDGRPAFSIDEVSVTTEIPDDRSSIDFEMEVSGIKGDLTLAEDPQTKAMVEQLGIKSLDGNITLQGSWTLASGAVDITEYAMDFARIGRLEISLGFSGYTLDFIKALNETTRAAEANADKNQAQQAAGLAMLGLMQRLTFNNAEIRFEDDGITNKALELAGKKQGMTAKQTADMLKGMTPLMLAQYNVPELQNMLSEAVNTYLDKPGSFTITASPGNGVPFPMIMGAAMGAPNTLPKVLGVKVTAND